MERKNRRISVRFFKSLSLNYKEGGIQNRY